jgi:hypothetical protein
METWRHRHSDMETWRNGDMETSIKKRNMEAEAVCLMRLPFAHHTNRSFSFAIGTKQTCPSMYIIYI